MFGVKNSSLVTVIAKDCMFQGDINTKGTIRIDGQFEGRILCDWLIVGQKAFIKGEFNVRAITISGELNGKINSTDIVEILDSGIVNGDIRTPKITIHDGGIFQGLSIMDNPMVKIDLLGAEQNTAS